MRNIIWMLLFVTVSLSFAETASDKSIKPLDTSREELVKESFRALVSAYLDKDIDSFMSYVSESKFQQDYMTFDDAIREDFRVYNLFNLDYWFEQIIPDGEQLIYMKVRWEKEYESIKRNRLLQKSGSSWFLFVKSRDGYKLIGMAGAMMWGDSRKEWVQERPISSRKIR